MAGEGRVCSASLLLPPRGLAKDHSALQRGRWCMEALVDVGCVGCGVGGSSRHIARTKAEGLPL